ncbi:hypothetical protein AAHA92_15115 [Salvia divinorum]|uniref:Uncharacterized protein n=1 Tax=Salvia divinorum TaxID=28513 RepID=A0ABD1HF32_SALDI
MRQKQIPNSSSQLGHTTYQSHHYFALGPHSVTQRPLDRRQPLQVSPGSSSAAIVRSGISEVAAIPFVHRVGWACQREASAAPSAASVGLHRLVAVADAEVRPAVVGVRCFSLKTCALNW